jgi:PAS domain S-box-containing protein
MNIQLPALEKQTLTTKLLIGFGFGLMIAAMVGVNAINSMRVMSEKSNTIYEKELLGISHLKEANINLIYMGRSLQQMMLAQNVVEREKAQLRLDKAKVTLQAELDEARKHIFREDAKWMLTRFDNLFEQYQRNVAHTMELMGKDSHKLDEAVAYIARQEFFYVIDTADDTLTAITKIMENGAYDTAEELAKLAERSNKIALLLLLLGLAVGIVAGLIVGKSIQRPNDRLRNSIEGLAAGRLDDVIPNTDYPNEIGAFARAIQSLQKVYRSMEMQRWIKSYVTEISAKIQQAESYEELARRLLSATCPLLGASIGVLYLHEENQLRMLASYGWRERKNLNQELVLGEGLLGQSALEKKTITITEPPEDYIKISSALGESTPRVVTVLPIMHGGELVAMMELASFQNIGEREAALLDALLPMIAMTMEILGKNISAQQMMQEAQERAIQMEVQAAQLEEQSVEMAAQQSELQKTEEWYRYIVQSADAMLVIDERGVIILSNPKADTIFGYKSDTLIGQRAEVVVPAWKDFSEAEDAVDMNTLDALHMDGSAIQISVALTRLPSIGLKTACSCLSIKSLTYPLAA